MPPLTISQSLAAEVLRLVDLGSPPSEIALKLGLKKMQISSIVAHRDILARKASGSFEFTNGPTDESDDFVVALDNAAPAANESPDEQEVGGEETEALGIYVGDDVEYQDSRYWAPWESREVQNPHLMIIGESGSGKTYAVQCLVAELARHDMPSVIFDYGQSFELEFLEKEFVRHFSPSDYLIGEEGLALNPLQIFPKDLQGPNAVASRVSDVFDAVYRLGDIQRKVLIDAILRSFERVGIQASDRGTWTIDPPNLSVLQEILENMAADKSYPSYKNAAGVSARLTTFFMLNSFRTDSHRWSWENLIKETKERVHILQFRGLEGKTQRIVVELLLWHLFFYLKSEGQHPLRVYCILDEAHHLSFRDGGPIDSLLREARKFGLGIIFASQQPEDFSSAAFSNSASKLVFQTSDPTLRVSKFLAQKCRNHEDPKEIHDLISTLQQGQAFFITENKGYVIRIADFKMRATLWG
jgi:DNA phosphorothioation-dependent restriction protein DptH